MRPAPTIATWGGTTTSAACRPPNVPKLDSVMVAPRSSSSGTVRASTSRFIASRPRRRSAGSRAPTLRSTGANSPSPVSMAMARSTFLWSRRATALPSYQAFSAGSAWQAATIARTRRTVTSLPVRPGLHVGLVRQCGRNDLGVGPRHARGHGAAHAAQGLRRAGLGQGASRRARHRPW